MEWTPKIAGLSRTMSVHMTVAQAFIGPSEGRQVRHLNGNKLDNRLENLEYGTPLENQADRKQENHQGAQRLTLKQETIIKERSSQGERTQVLADEFGVSRSVIESILDKKQTDVSKELVWKCVQTGAGISVIAAFLNVDHSAVSVCLKKHFEPMRKLRRNYPLNKSISVDKLARLINTK